MTVGRLPAYQVTCQAPHPDPRRARHGELHGAVIASITVPVQPTGRLFRHPREMPGDPVDGSSLPGRYAFKCRACRVASEYVEVR